MKYKNNNYYCELIIFDYKNKYNINVSIFDLSI